MPQFTVDRKEKQSISRIAHTNMLKRMMSVDLDADSPLGSVAALRATFKDEELDSEIDTVETAELGVFSDSGLSIPSSTAALRSASVGTILHGENTAMAKLESTDGGEFACEVFNSAPTKVYVGVVHSFGSSRISCRDAIGIDFS